jgi:acetyltransferase
MSKLENSSVHSLINPQSVAIIGASDSTESWAGRVFQYLTQFGNKGKIFPVNPKYKELKGFPCYESIDKIPEPADVVTIAIPAASVFDVLDKARVAAVKNAVIISSGFAERDGNGRKLQAELIRRAAAANIRILGPNCLGLINASAGTVLSSTQALLSGRLPLGPVSIVAHSGAFAGSLLSQLADRGTGIRYWVSTGNEADLELSDFIDYFCDDPETTVIAMFVEGIRNGSRFLQAMQKIRETGKIGIALKIGRSAVASGIAKSHTAALTGSDEAYDAVFRKFGIIRVDTLEELADTAALFASYPRPRAKRIAVLSPSGGVAGIMADKCERFALEFSPLTENEQRIIDEEAGIGGANNPMDFGSSRSKSIVAAFPACLKAADGNIGSACTIVALTTMPGIERIAESMVAFRDAAKPVILLNMAGGAGSKASEVALQGGLPVFVSTDQCLQAVSNWINYRNRDRFSPVSSFHETPLLPSDAKGLIEAAIGQNRMQLDEYQAKLVLKEYGIPVTTERFAGNCTEAIAIAREIGFPVVLKIVSPDILHKTEVGGVITNIQSESELEKAYRILFDNVRRKKPDARLAGVLVQEMLKGGIELFAGVHFDESFGHILVFGLGGIYVELFKDVARRPLPLTPEDVDDLLSEVKTAKILYGLRGKAGYDIAAVKGLLLRLSDFVADCGPLIQGLDLNPFMVFENGKGAKVMDTVLLLRRPACTEEDLAFHATS